MNYYECAIYLDNQDDTIKAYLSERYEPGMSSIAYRNIEYNYANQAFKNSKLKLIQVIKPFHNFLSVNYRYAQRYLEKIIPFFDEMEWAQVDSVYPLHNIYFCSRIGIRLHLTEKSIHEMPKELIAPYFERVCDTVDVFFDDWFEPEGLPGECVIERAV